MKRMHSNIEGAFHERSYKVRWRAIRSMALAISMIMAASQSPAEGANIPSKITLAIGTNAGGGYDLYGRLVARHIGRFLHNKPALLPINMPGAGQLIMTNWLHNVAPKDGSAIGLVPSSTAFEKLFGNPRAEYDARAFKWIGSLNGYYTVAIVWHSSPTKDARDLFKRETVIGGGAPASDVTLWPQLLNNVLGTKLKIINGYVGTAKISMALESGEVEGMIGADWDGIKLSRPDWVRDKKIRVVLQLVGKRQPELSEVPTMFDFVKSAEDRALLRLFDERQEYGRPLAMPPGTPDDVVKAMRAAFSAMLRDPDFQNEARKLGAVINPASGEEIAALVQNVYATPKPIIDRAVEETRKISK
ncbi:MAG: hypothetical protein IT536_12100 [Hyphomicrobiales bacterium]|nr:hypothetical protein [Hyphomicrobiales bacterium]